VLDPDVILHADAGPGRPETVVVRGAEAVARRAYSFRRLSPWARPALVNGVVGTVTAPEGRIFSVLSYVVRGGKIVEIDAIADPRRLAALGL
jgi:RNA polymerase sigma-70 factor (ECF subfamily)